MEAKTVWKYVLEGTDEQIVRMPQGAQILHVNMQHGSLALWARVCPDHPEIGRKIRIAGTGHPLAEASDADYLGTFIMHNGALVFHAFDMGEVRE